jgi:hypothetical protein
MELRCPHKKHGELVDGVIEIKCSSRFCGAANGVVVIHRWDALSGERLEDRRFADPVAARQQKGARL